MDEFEEANTRVWLLVFLQRYAPNGDAQFKCAELVHEAQKHGATDHEVVVMLVDTLSDGLHHGNWPW
jgi:hypothetical protein